MYILKFSSPTICISPLPQGIMITVEVCRTLSKRIENKQKGCAVIMKSFRKIFFTIFLSAVLCMGACACDFTGLGDFTGANHFAGLTSSTGSQAYAASKSTSSQSSAALAKPVIKVKASGVEVLKVSWDKVDGAETYYIYRAASKSGKYKKIASTSKRSYSDKKISQNKTYYYKVKAVRGDKSSKFSAVKSAKINTVPALEDIPAYSGKPYIILKDNVPAFSARMISAAEESYETYSKLDSLTRPQAAAASIGPDLMPETERESIGMVKPAGFSTVRYDDLIEDKYLYNRCHMIGFQLTGQNANLQNLITGTRYMNVDGMLPWENQVADYIRKTGNHVLYRVTPVYEGKDLLCRGLQLEAYSVEDGGEGLSFHVFVYNVQPGIVIDYATGDSHRASADKSVPVKKDTDGIRYILNTNTKKFHIPTCSSVDDMKEKNKRPSSEDRGAIISQGYDPCKRCRP